jgi:hypothetical protein
MSFNYIYIYKINYYTSIHLIIPNEAPLKKNILPVCRPFKFWNEGKRRDCTVAIDSATGPAQERWVLVFFLLLLLF